MVARSIPHLITISGPQVAKETKVNRGVRHRGTERDRDAENMRRRTKKQIHRDTWGDESVKTHRALALGRQ